MKINKSLFAFFFLMAALISKSSYSMSLGELSPQIIPESSPQKRVPKRKIAQELVAQGQTKQENVSEDAANVFAIPAAASKKRKNTRESQAKCSEPQAQQNWLEQSLTEPQKQKLVELAEQVPTKSKPAKQKASIERAKHLARVTAASIQTREDQKTVKNSAALASSTATAAARARAAEAVNQYLRTQPAATASSSSSAAAASKNNMFMAPQPIQQSSSSSCSSSSSSAYGASYNPFAVPAVASGSLVAAPIKLKRFSPAELDAIEAKSEESYKAQKQAKARALHQQEPEDPEIIAFLSKNHCEVPHEKLPRYGYSDGTQRFLTITEMIQLNKYKPGKH